MHQNQHLNNQRLHIYKFNKDGTINYRWVKLMYTFALRLGVNVETSSNEVVMYFSGEFEKPSNIERGHAANNAQYIGTLNINGVGYDQLTVVLGENRRNHNKYWVTFWKDGVFPDDKKSPTSPLIKIYEYQHKNNLKITYTFDKVATDLHKIFVSDTSKPIELVMAELFANDNDEIVQKELKETIKNLTLANKKLKENFEQSEARAKFESNRADEEKREKDQITESLLFETLARDEAEERADQEKQEKDLIKQKFSEYKAKFNLYAPIAHITNIEQAEPLSKAGNEWNPGVYKVIKVDWGVAGKQSQKAVKIDLQDENGYFFTVYNNWPRGLKERYEMTKMLENQLIRYSTWGNYNRNKWFKNIEPINGQVALEGKHMTVIEGLK